MYIVELYKLSGYETASVMFASCVFCSQGFRLLLASPDVAYKLFRGLQHDGHGQARLFEGGLFTVCDVRLSDEKKRKKFSVILNAQS